METNFLPLFGMVSNFIILNITMLSWITFIKSLTSILVHVIDKKNLVVDILSKTRYSKEKKCLYKRKIENWFKASCLLQVKETKVMKFYPSKLIYIKEG